MDEVLRLLYQVFHTVLGKDLATSIAARRHQDLRVLATQRGYVFDDHLPLDKLSTFASPPWWHFPYGLRHPHARQTLACERPAGRIAAVNFHAYMRNDDDGPYGDERLSVVALQLRDPASLDAVRAFVSTLAPANGLRVVMRADSVYAMFPHGPISLIRNAEMSYREQMHCMGAMAHLLSGDFAQARVQFGQLPRYSPGRVAVYVPLLLGTAAWTINSALTLYLGSYSPASLIGGAIFCMIFATVVGQRIHRPEGLAAFFGQKA